MSAPDWRREVEHAQKGGGAERARGQGVANEREKGRDAIRSRRAEGRSCEKAHVRVCEQERRAVRGAERTCRGESPCQCVENTALWTE